MPVLVLSFLVIAALYATVGFGGGSSYTAMLVLVGTDFRLIPIIALTCNLIVVTGGTINYARAGLLHANVILPFTALSVPMAWLGGITPVDQHLFILILGIALLGSGLAMLLHPEVEDDEAPEKSPGVLWSTGIVAGSLLGYLAGLVGIGGGILLAPAMHLMRLAPAKIVAATASVFILVNSCAGLIGQWTKLGQFEMRGDLMPYLWVFPAVLLGGQLGSRLGIRLLSPLAVRRLTAVLVIFVAGRLLFGWYTES
jgi:uncharacterized membrane protein YfcA